MYARIVLKAGNDYRDDNYTIQYMNKSGVIFEEYTGSFTDLFPFVIPDDNYIKYLIIEIYKKEIRFTGSFKQHLYNHITIDYKGMINILKFQLT